MAGKKKYELSYYERNKEKVKARVKEYKKNNKEKIKEYMMKNKGRWREWEGRNDGYYSVYLLPNENYVGQTQGIRQRILNHKSKGNDTSDYKVLHTFETRDEALAKEAEYHAMGYEGKHSQNTKQYYGKATN